MVAEVERPSIMNKSMDEDQARRHLSVTEMPALQRSMSPRGQAAGILPGSYKDHFMVGLRSKDVAVSAAAVRVLCGLLHNKSVDPEVLDAAGADSSPAIAAIL